MKSQKHSDAPTRISCITSWIQGAPLALRSFLTANLTPMERSSLRGAVVSLNTPFDDQDRIHLPSLEKLIELHLHEGSAQLEGS